MRLNLDRASDTLYVRVSDAPIEESEELAPGIVADYDAEGKLVALEVLDVSQREGAAELLGQRA
jgi:uncharacterized protein YuzE